MAIATLPPGPDRAWVQQRNNIDLVSISASFVNILNAFAGFVCKMKDRAIEAVEA